VGGLPALVVFIALGAPTAHAAAHGAATWRGAAILATAAGAPDAAPTAPALEIDGGGGEDAPDAHAPPKAVDHWSMLTVLILSTFIGLGVIVRVSRLLHTPLMSLTNAISAIAVVGSIMVTGADYPTEIRILGAVALFASMTNIVSGFLITDRMLRMFKQTRTEGGR
jgi:NAD(P) transhydrogenase subunit alpha